MKGAFTCPHCMTQNACDCETCKPFIKEGEPVNKWDETGNILICGKCGKNYSPDQSLDAEFKLINLKQQSMTKEQILGNYYREHTDTETAIYEAMEHYKEQEVAKERESHINMVKQIVELLGFAKCLNILDALEKWQKEREKAKKLVEALEDIISQNQCCKEDYVISQIIKIAEQSLTEYEKL